MILVPFGTHKTHGCGRGRNIPIYFVLLQAAPGETQLSGSFFSLTRHGPFALTILGLLLLFSLLSWTIMVRKWLTFRMIERQSHAFISFFRKSPRLSEVSTACEHYPRTPLTGIFSAAYQELNTQLQTLGAKAPAGSNPGHPVLGDRNLNGIERSLQRASAAELSVLERNMSWLATTASATPFIGLLGTVVGIMDAFQGLGLEKTASIQAVAPGISEALWTTAAGLFAAIPAVVGYNQFVHRIKEIGAEMDDFSAELLNLIDRSFG